MEQRPPAEPQPEKPPKEPLVSKSVLVIIGIFAVVNVIVVALVFWPKFFASGEEQKPAGPLSPLANVTMVDLGRLQITKPLDPLQQNYMRIDVSIQLQIPSEGAAELEAKIKKFEGLFKEQARKAFRDADARDLASENLAGVKNAIKARINEGLGTDAVKEVVFGDFKPY